MQKIALTIMAGLFLTAFAFLTTPAHASDILPFPVRLDGQMAIEDQAIFARIPKPVPNTAKLEVDSNSPMIIINIFPADEKGTPQQISPQIIMLTGTNSTTLDNTMTKIPPQKGRYLMNIVAGGQTARVVFEVL